MGPERSSGATGGEQVDDDRLLAYALGLEDDPELALALESDARLHERLQRIQVELREVEEELRAAVPPVDEDWADLSSQRWEALRPYVRTRPAKPRYRLIRLKVLVPAAAAIALALGVTLSHQTLRQGSGAAKDGSAVTAASAPESSQRKSAYDSPTQFKTIVVARAQAPKHDAQQFTVERVLKGSAPATVKLTIEAGEALPQGTLAVLSLLPVDTVSSGAASTPRSATPLKQGDSETVYSFEGRLAAVQQLPPGAQPADVTLP